MKSLTRELKPCCNKLQVLSYVEPAVIRFTQNIDYILASVPANDYIAFEALQSDELIPRVVVHADVYAWSHARELSVSVIVQTSFIAFSFQLFIHAFNQIKAMKGKCIQHKWTNIAMLYQVRLQIAQSRPQLLSPLLKLDMHRRWSLRCLQMIVSPR